MKILIAFASTEGHTGKVARFAGNHLQGLGHEVLVFDTSSTSRDVDVGEFDKVLLAGSVHEQRHQENLEIFVTVKRDQLSSRPVMFISVSLAAAFKDTKSEAEKYINTFLSGLNWKPSASLAVAGAIKHDEYGYYREQILKHVVLEGSHIDDTVEDQEFTDWDELARQIEAFLNA